MSTVLLSGTGTYQPLVTVSIAQAIQVALNDWSSLPNVVNPLIQRAEAGQPEDALMELDVTGWRIPLVGSVGDQVAAHVNALWSQGRIYDPATGETPRAWPGSTVIATYVPGTDTLVLRWVKGQPFIVWVLGGILVVLGVLYAIHLVQGWFGGGSYHWSLSSAAPSTKGLPLLDQLAIGGGIALLLGFAAWFYTHLKIAEAGAPKTTQQFIFEGR